MPNYQRLAVLVAGHRAEHDELTSDAETAKDLIEAERVAQTAAAFDPSLDAAARIRTAWDAAGEILEITTDFRAAVAYHLRQASSSDGEARVEPADLWNRGVGYSIEFSPDRRAGPVGVAILRVGDQDAGRLTFAEDEGTGGVTRIELIDAQTPDPFTRRGHAERLVLALTRRYPEAVFADGPSTNTETGERLLASLRRRMTIHGSLCFRAGRGCICPGNA